MIPVISYILIAGCCIVCLLQNTKHRLLVGLIFCATAIFPELTGSEGIEYIAICAMSAIFSCILIAQILPCTKYALNIMILLCFEITLNIYGVFDWFSHLSIKVSNFLFDITNYSFAQAFGELYIYDALAMSYYIAALITLLDGKIFPDARNSIAFNFAMSYSWPFFSNKGGQ
jgi:hypothetical protein